MSFNNGKLLELLSVECDAEYPHIIIRISCDEIDANIKWDIDLETAKQLYDLIEPNYKYRLSFQTMPIPTKNSHYSWITKTHGDKSENILFPCSNDYVDGLESIKSCSQPNDLVSNASFTLISLSQPEELKRKDKKKPQPFILKQVRLAVALCIVILLILVYTGKPYNNEAAFAKKRPANHLVIKDTTMTAQTKEGQPKLNRNVVPKRKPNVVPDFQINKLIASTVPKGSVALTFDDGPSKNTKEIADILKRNHAGGTFFFIGQNVKKLPDMVQYVHRNGFSIGNHTMNHPDLTTMSSEEQQKEIRNTSKLIEKLISEPVTLFRPPYEANNQSTINVIEQDHLNMVLWDRDPRDWQTKDSKEILHYIKTNEESGAVILLHESENVVDILPAIISYLQSQHLQLVTLKADGSISQQ